MEAFLNLAGEHVVADGDTSVAAALVELLTQREETLTTAESCTGGAMAATVTSVAGSSAVFEGAVVAYANAIKVNALGVDESDIERDGAVSESVVTAMAEGARERMGTTYALQRRNRRSRRHADKPVGTIGRPGHAGRDRGALLETRSPPRSQRPPYGAGVFGLGAPHALPKRALSWVAVLESRDFFRFFAVRKNLSYEPRMSTHC